MQIIIRTFQFVNMAVTAIIVAAIVLMILRLIADAADLNPFGWAARTIRRLTDAFVIPVRGAMRGFGFDPKYAPLIVILLTILLGFFLLQLVQTVAWTIAGLIVALAAGEITMALGFILYGLLSIYLLLIFMRIVFSWGMVSYTNRLMRFLVNATEPLLGPLRKILPTLGPMDISPIVAVLLIWLFQGAIMGTLLRGAPAINI
jgi:YggT family protein